MDRVECADCGKVFDNPVSTGRCPSCGSGDRNIYASDSVTCEEYQCIKEKDGRRTVKRGDDFYSKTGEWRNLHMTVDPDNDKYMKIVLDRATEQELYRCEEPLSQHTGRGSAKRRKRRPQ